MGFDNQLTAPKAAGMSDRRKVQRLTPRLLAWYAIHARTLPWRHMNDPYAIWISEIMLQQTRAATVIPYWTRWIRAFPDVQTLARAHPTRVLKLWAGLGYYSRARNLQQSAREIMKNHDGQLPRDAQSLQSLPGIGRYTAGAICSIAFNLPEPILDGNIIRVLTRLFAIEGNPKSANTERRLWILAEQFVTTTTEHGALNQALMELGATVCRPRNPGCSVCPLKRSCTALRLYDPETYPRGKKKLKMLEQHWRVLVIMDNGEFLIRQRPTGGVNGDLWEFPTLELENSRAPSNWATTLTGALVKRPHQISTLSHFITRYRIRIGVWKTDLLGPRPKGHWMAKAALDQIPFAGAHRKVLRTIQSAE